jgi:mono/diheme cytochrome c family protein
MEGMRKIMSRYIGRFALIVIGAFLVLWAAQEMGLGQQAPQVPPDIRSGKNPLVSSDAVLAKAKKAYVENCLQCHGETGKGDGPMSGMLKERPADLSDPAIVGPMTDGEIFWAATKGRLPVMPAFESKLTNQERWSLVLFLRDLSKTKPNTKSHNK